MITINISLPDKLREQANKLIKKGYYASFSDLTRTALRDAIANQYLDQLIIEAKQTKRSQKGIPLNTDQDIDKFIESL